MSNYTRYKEAKEYFNDLSSIDHSKSIEILSDYEDLFKKHGEFIAAKFILDTYLDYMNTSGEEVG